MTVAPQSIAYGTATATLSASVAYTGTAAPAGALTFRVDTGASGDGHVLWDGFAFDLYGELFDFELDGGVAYDHRDGCGGC